MFKILKLCISLYRNLFAFWDGKCENSKLNCENLVLVYACLVFRLCRVFLHDLRFKANIVLLLALEINTLNWFYNYIIYVRMHGKIFIIEIGIFIAIIYCTHGTYFWFTYESMMYGQFCCSNESSQVEFVIWPTYSFVFFWSLWWFFGVFSVFYGYGLSLLWK